MYSFMKITIIILAVLLGASQSMAANSDKEAVETYLDKVAKFDSIIDKIMQGGLPVEQKIEHLEATREKLKALNIPTDARDLHIQLVKKYEPIIELVHIADKGMKEKKASSVEKRREVMGYWRKELEKNSERLVPVLHQAEEEFDRLILKHGIPATDVDINFHGLAVKKVNIHVTVLDSQERPIQGALVRGSFHQDLVVDDVKRFSHKGLTDSRGYCLLSGREDIYVDVRVAIDGYQDATERVIVRNGMDKNLKILLKKE